MPSIKSFNGVSQGYVNLITALSKTAVADSIKVGADFMVKGINNSPTPHPWHARKNEANNFPTGARIGNRNPMFWSPVDPDSGKMLESIDSSGPVTSASGSEIAGMFGWLRVQEDYFIDQDSGGYDVGSAMGMGLLNAKAPGAGGVLREYGARNEASRSLIKSMTSAGLKYRGEIV
jgi:hypothetical protein